MRVGDYTITFKRQLVGNTQIKTTAYITIGCYHLGTGEATQNPSDIENPVTGRKVALTRALANTYENTGFLKPKHPHRAEVWKEFLRSEGISQASKIVPSPKLYSKTMEMASALACQQTLGQFLMEQMDEVHRSWIRALLQRATTGNSTGRFKTVRIRLT